MTDTISRIRSLADGIDAEMVARAAMQTHVYTRTGMCVQTRTHMYAHIPIAARVREGPRRENEECKDGARRQ